MSYRIPKVRLSLVRDGSVLTSSRTVSQGSDVADIVRSAIGDPPQEHFVAIDLDARSRPIGIRTVSIGTVNSTLVHPRDVFSGAIVSGACALVVAHNHPSGDPTPSREDHDVTDRLLRAGRLLGIPILDHVVIGANGTHVSFSEMGWLERLGVEP